jgi:hypothetical protein
VLNLRGEQLTGHVMGRVVSAWARPASAGRPGAGVYRILPPREAPLLGAVVVAVPAMQGPTPVSVIFTDMMVGSAVYQSGWPEGALLFSDKPSLGVRMKSLVVGTGFDAFVSALEAGKGGDITLA